MQHGFIKIAAATPHIHVADCHYNAAQIIALMGQAQMQGVSLLVLPELCLTGYTCGDLFFQDVLMETVRQALQKICIASEQSSMLTVLGLPWRHQNKLYNCAAVLQSGQVLGLICKTYLPNYGEFYEQRHFSSAPTESTKIEILGQRVSFGSKLLFQCASMPAFCFGVEICEDLWGPFPPSNDMAIAGATIIVNPAASDEAIGKETYRRQLVESQSRRLCCAYVLSGAGQGESTSDMVFAGHKLIAENGVLMAETLPFQDGLTITEVDTQRLLFERRKLSSFADVQATSLQHNMQTFSMPLVHTSLTRKISPHPFLDENPVKMDARCKTILQIQSHGLKQRIEHTGAKSLIIGVSGGLDSTLALLVCKNAIDLMQRPHSDIIAVTMPCFGTTDRTRQNAQTLCAQLGILCREIDISKAVQQHFSDIGHDERQHDVTFENAQARERTQVLMDLANQTGGLVVGTGDLSELALGWATYNGDHMSMYSVNASIPKTLMRYMIRYIAKTSPQALETVLMDILNTPVSPELLPAEEGTITQKTEDIVGPYELHDFFLYYTVRWGMQPEKILYLAQHAFGGDYDQAVLVKWLNTFYRRFFSQQFKRSCMPEGPKIGSVSLSPRADWRMPSDANPSAWMLHI